ncbi:hypothetical protein M9434_004408 [Picochlorum sp. BPE23]|nr:hypothetical protein M9434_004408 [Picochlorum sp. BPE23]
MGKTAGLLLRVFILALLALSSLAQKTCKVSKDDASLARYIFELWNNRQDKCESGGDFLRDKKSINYRAQSLCKEDLGGGVTKNTAKYRYKNCRSKKVEDLEIVFQTKQCFAQSDPLLSPMRVLQSKEAKMPKNCKLFVRQANVLDLNNNWHVMLLVDDCPAGTQAVVIEKDQDKDFTQDWEFRHQVENVYKYDLANINKGCNAYVSTKTDKACYNPTTKEYEGYATVTLECIDSGKKEQVPIYLKAVDLGRALCPWPEIVKGSPGYDPAFNFISSSDDSGLLIPASQTPTVPAQPVPSPPAEKPPSSPPAKELTTKEKLNLAVKCMKDEKLSVITGGPRLRERSLVWNKLNDTVALAVVEPASTDDVGKAVGCMYRNGVRSVPKSGGHSYDGFSVLSSAVTIDLNKMKKVTLNQDSSALVQGGTTLGELYNEIWKQSKGKYAVVGGTCPAVGVGGHLLGGGIGFLNRMFGLACDQVLRLTMINYQGQTIQASPSQNKDLFWASCGGGGGNFGIVTEYTIKTVNVPPKVTTFDFVVRKDLVAFLEHMQNVVPDAADPLISGVQMNVEDGQVEVQGLYLGEKSNLDNVLKSSKMFGFSNKINSEQMSWIESAIKFAEYPSVKKPEDMAKTKNIEAKYRDYFNLNSFYIIPSKPLPKEAFEKMLDWAKQNKDGFIEFDLMGPKGKIASIASDATAYTYRTALYSVQFGNEWEKKQDSNKLIGQTVKLDNEMTPYLSQPAPPRVINYLDIQTPSLLGYYGANLQRLRTIKTQYDPQNYFQNPLTIPPLATTTAPVSPAFNSDQGPATDAPISAGIEEDASESPVSQETTTASMASYRGTLRASIAAFVYLVLSLTV